jgi:hypothetical protein
MLFEPAQGFYTFILGKPQHSVHKALAGIRNITVFAIASCTAAQKGIYN